MKFFLSVLFLLVSFKLFSAEQILVIQSYNSEYRWDKSYTKGISDVLSKKHHLSFVEMNCKKVSVAACKENAEIAYEKYNSIKPSLVILGDDYALKYLGPKLSKVKTPVVFLGINNNPRTYFDKHRLPPNMTGFLERPNLRRALNQMSHVMPNSKKALVIFDTTFTSRIASDFLFEEQKQVKVRGIEVSKVHLDKMSDLKNVIRKAKGKYDYIFLGLFQNVKDSKGKVLSSDEVVRWVSETTEVPLFGLWDFSIGKGMAIGGFVIDSYRMGYDTGKIALRIFEGELPNKISPVFFDRAVNLFSTSEIQKWKISLPAHFTKNIKLIE